MGLRHRHQRPASQEPPHSGGRHRRYGAGAAIPRRGRAARTEIFLARIVRFLFWLLVLSWGLRLLRRIVGGVQPEQKSHDASKKDHLNDCELNGRFWLITLDGAV